MIRNRIVKVGDWVKCVGGDLHSMKVGKSYKVVDIRDNKWYFIHDDGQLDWWVNPLSINFELDKSASVLEIIKDL